MGQKNSCMQGCTFEECLNEINCSQFENGISKFFVYKNIEIEHKDKKCFDFTRDHPKDRRLVLN